MNHIMVFWWLMLFFIDWFLFAAWEVLYVKKHKNPYGKDSKYTIVIDTSTVGCTLLRNVSSFLFFMSGASLWPWATRPGCFSRVIAFFSSSIIFYLIQNPWGCSFLIYKHACLDFFNWPLKFIIRQHIVFIMYQFKICPFFWIPSKYSLGLPSQIFWYGRIRLCQQP